MNLATMKGWCTVHGITVVIVMLLMLGGCTDEKPPIKVGFVGGLTGRTSDLGISVRNGVILAVEEVNAAGGIEGRPVDLITRDDRQDPQTALEVDRELIDAGVVVIIGHLTSQMSVVTVPLMNASRILMLSPTTSTSKLSGLDDSFIRVIASTAAGAAHLARFTFHERRLHRIVVAFDTSNQAFTEEYYTVFEREYHRMGGGEVLSVAFDGGAITHYSDLADRIRDHRPDGVVIAASARDTALLCQHLRRKDQTLSLFASAWAYTEDFIQHGGPYVEGVIFPQWFHKQSDAPAFVAFSKRFQARFGVLPNFANTFGYEAAGVLFAGLRRTSDPRQLKAAIIAQGQFPGLQGDIRIDRFGDADRPSYLFTVADGQFQVM